MNDTDLLPRRLDAGGCVIAGNQLAAHRKALAQQKIKLTKEVDARVDAVVAATEPIATISADETTMTSVDRGADRFIAGFDGIFAEIERSFDHEDVVPLTAAEQDLRDTARALRGRLFPTGTDYLRLPYRTQWTRMSALHAETKKSENVADAKKLGLSLWLARLERWVTLYGAKLGVTEAQDDVDPVAKAVDAWHVAWADLLLEVRSTYRDAGKPEHVTIRKQLLSPYEDEARRERAEEVKAQERAKRREQKNEKTAEPPK